MEGTLVIGMDLATAVRHAAIAGAIKDKAVKEAKAAITEGASEAFDFTARFHGTLTKGHATISPGREVTNPQRCDLFNPVIVAMVLQRAGLTSADIRKHLKAIVTKGLKAGKGEKLFIFGDGDLESLMHPFNEVAAETVAKLPPVTTTVAASSVAGAVKVNVAGVEFLDGASPG